MKFKLWFYVLASLLMIGVLPSCCGCFRGSRSLRSVEIQNYRKLVQNDMKFVLSDWKWSNFWVNNCPKLQNKMSLNRNQIQCSDRDSWMDAKQIWHQPLADPRCVIPSKMPRVHHIHHGPQGPGTLEAPPARGRNSDHPQSDWRWRIRWFRGGFNQILLILNRLTGWQLIPPRNTVLSFGVMVTVDCILWKTQDMKVNYQSAYCRMRWPGLCRFLNLHHQLHLIFIS